MVANNATASTVAFIAPGPPNPPITQVMYVGVTWTGNGPYRSEVPAASSRSLDSGTLFQIAETAVTTGTRMFVNSLARERYPINYVYGFSSEGFSYFLTTQMKQVSHISFSIFYFHLFTKSDYAKCQNGRFANKFVISIESAQLEGGYKLFGLAQNFAINKKSTIVVQSL